MKTTLIIISILAFNWNISNAQNRLTKEIIDFHEVYVKGRIEVELIPSDEKQFTMTSRYISLEEVEVEFKNKGIYLKTKPKINSEENVIVKLPYKEITVIETATGAIVNSAQNLKTTDLKLKSTSGGKIELTIEAQTVSAEVTQVSDIILYGTTKTQEVDLNTGGNYLAYDLECENTEIKAVAGSQGKVTASKKIDAVASSKAYIGYIGNPAVTNVKTSLGGKIASFKTREDLHN